MIATGSSRLMAWHLEKVGEGEAKGGLTRDRFDINVERLAVRRLCWVTGGSAARCVVLNMSRRYIGSLDKSLHALPCSQGAGVDIFSKIWNWTEHLDHFVTEMYPRWQWELHESGFWFQKTQFLHFIWELLLGSRCYTQHRKLKLNVLLNRLLILIESDQKLTIPLWDSQGKRSILEGVWPNAARDNCNHDNPNNDNEHYDTQQP